MPARGNGKVSLVNWLPLTLHQAHSIFFCVLTLCPWTFSMFILTWSRTRGLVWEVKMWHWTQGWNFSSPRLPKSFHIQKSRCIQYKYDLILCGFKRIAYYLPEAQFLHWDRGSTSFWTEMSSVADFSVILSTRNFKDRLLCFDNHLAALRSGTKLPRICICANYVLMLWNILLHDVAVMHDLNASSLCAGLPAITDVQRIGCCCSLGC